MNNAIKLASEKYPLDGLEFDKDYITRTKIKRQAFSEGYEAMKKLIMEWAQEGLEITGRIGGAVFDGEHIVFDCLIKKLNEL